MNIEIVFIRGIFESIVISSMYPICEMLKLFIFVIFHNICTVSSYFLVRILNLKLIRICSKPDSTVVVILWYYWALATYLGCRLSLLLQTNLAKFLTTYLTVSIRKLASVVSDFFSFQRALFYILIGFSIVFWNWSFRI